MTLPANVRATFLLNFPATAIGSGPVTLTKQNGIWTAGFSIAQLGQQAPPAANFATDFLLGYDSIANAFFKVPFTGIALPSGLFAFSANVNFANANADTQIPIQLPPGFTRYQVNQVFLSGPTGSLTTGTFGLFTAAAGGGVALIPAGTVPTITTSADATNNNSELNTPVNGGTQSYLLSGQPTLFFRVGTAVAATTVNVTVLIRPLP